MISATREGAFWPRKTKVDPSTVERGALKIDTQQIPALRVVNAAVFIDVFEDLFLIILSEKHRIIWRSCCMGVGLG